MPASSKDNIIDDIRAIREDIEYIKSHMVDIDMVLTPEEEKFLEEGRREFKEGRARTLAELKRERK